MKYLDYLIVESIEMYDVYEFNGKLVRIIHVDYLTSSEITVSYEYEDGTISAYTDTIKDFEEDFKETDKIFVKKKEKKENNKRYNLVYYHGKKKVETIKYNLNIKDVSIFKNYYSGFEKYKLGTIKKELVR